MSDVLTWEQEARKLIHERPGFAAVVARLQAPRRAGTAGLTRRQSEALSFIRAYLAASDGIGPSYTEIMAALGLGSKSGVHRIITSLERRGYVDRIPGLPRSICVVQP